jgi:hypothetical protein
MSYTTVNRRRLVWLAGEHQSKAANMLRIKEKISRDQMGAWALYGLYNLICFNFKFDRLPSQKSNERPFEKPKSEDMEPDSPNSHEEKTEGELFQSQAINLDFESEKEAEELGIDSVLDTDESLLVDEVYKLDISVFIAETETPEADDVFDDALFEMEGKKSFNCNICSKVCKSKGGLTRHQNSKHAETTKGRDNIPGLHLIKTR